MDGEPAVGEPIVRGNGSHGRRPGGDPGRGVRRDGGAPGDRVTAQASRDVG